MHIERKYIGKIKDSNLYVTFLAHDEGKVVALGITGAPSAVTRIEGKASSNRADSMGTINTNLYGKNIGLPKNNGRYVYYRARIESYSFTDAIILDENATTVTEETKTAYVFDDSDELNVIGSRINAISSVFIPPVWYRPVIEAARTDRKIRLINIMPKQSVLKIWAIDFEEKEYWTKLVQRLLKTNAINFDQIAIGGA